MLLPPPHPAPHPPQCSGPELVLLPSLTYSPSPLPLPPPHFRPRPLPAPHPTACRPGQPSLLLAGHTQQLQSPPHGPGTSSALSTARPSHLPRATQLRRSRGRLATPAGCFGACVSNPCLPLPLPPSTPSTRSPHAPCPKTFLPILPAVPTPCLLTGSLLWPLLVTAVPAWHWRVSALLGPHLISFQCLPQGPDIRLVPVKNNIAIHNNTCQAQVHVGSMWSLPQVQGPQEGSEGGSGTLGLKPGSHLG